MSKIKIKNNAIKEDLNDNLIELINSLSPKEKRYITINLSQYKSKNNTYLILFKHYSLNNTKKQASLEDKIQNISVINIQLYWKILKALQLYYSENNIILIKNNLLNQYKILLNKGLTNQALKILTQIKNICVKNDFIEDLFYIKREELKLLTEMHSYQRKEDVISDFNKITLNNLKKTRQFNTLLKIYYQNKLSINFYRNSIDTNSIKIINSFVINLEEPEILSISSKLLYHLNYGIYLLLSNNGGQSINHILNVFELMFESEQQSQNLAINQNDIYEILLVCFLYENNAKYFEKWYSKSKLIQDKNSAINFKSFYFEFQSQLLWKKKQYDELLNCINQYKNFIQIQKIEKTYQIELHIIRYYLGIQNFDKALYHIKLILEKNNLQYKPEVQFGIKLLKCNLLFIDSQFIEIQNEINNLKYYIKKFNLEDAFSKGLFNLFKEIFKLEKKHTKPSVLTKHYKIELEKLLELEDYKMNFLINFDFKVFL